MAVGKPWAGYRLRVGTPVRLRARYDGVIVHYGPDKGEWMVKFGDGEIIACAASDLAARRQSGRREREDENANWSHKP